MIRRMCGVCGWCGMGCGRMGREWKAFWREEFDIPVWELAEFLGVNGLRAVGFEFVPGEGGRDRLVVVVAPSQPLSLPGRGESGTEGVVPWEV